MRPRANRLSMKQSKVVSYINPANHAPLVQIGHIPGVISSYVVVHYINPANQAPGVQTGH